MVIHSDWGDWLPQAISEASPVGVAAWYLGCNGFVLKANDGTTVFIDPYLGTGDPPRTVRMIPVPFDPHDVRDADAVLATHDHTDHVHGPSQAPILAATNATFYGADATIDVTRDEEWTTRWAVSNEQLEPVGPDDTIQIGSMTVNVEPAHDPDATQPVSFVIEHEAGTLFHGGDTKPDPILTDIGDRYDIDIGVLAFGSQGLILDKQTREPKRTRWYADENEVIEAAAMLQLDRFVPSHWDMWKGLTADPTALYDHARSYEYPRSVELVEIGDRIDLSS